METYEIIGICLIVLFLIIFIAVLRMAAEYNHFRRNLKYINSEIGRTEGEKKRFGKEDVFV